MNAKGCPLEGLFYPFGRAAGAYAGVLVLAEGWATAATVFDALGFDAAEPWQTLCCFGAKNMLAVAREWAENWMAETKRRLQQPRRRLDEPALPADKVPATIAALAYRGVPTLPAPAK